MDRYFCFHCMNPIDAPQAVCDQCGHDNQFHDNGPGMLGHITLEGRYQVGRVLGRGGFGVTYIGYDLQQERRVAIKEYFPAHLVMRGRDDMTISALTGSETDYDHGCQRALKESQVAARMGQIHGVVQVYNVFAANNTVYIIMEYVEGDTLSQYLEKHPRLSVTDAIELLSPVARALQILHKKDVVHRDIKPDNIMVHSQSEQGVLLDFGAARIADNSTISHSAAVVSQGYAPIEQYNLSSMDGRIDQYALAATLFHMLSGQRPPDVLQRMAQANCMPSLQSLN
ncbi:MAG: serine/threonine protein kinase, partial [Clostridia bacterium]|nr:serine/threonine protein kinase [Clostridia bacterium]